MQQQFSRCNIWQQTFFNISARFSPEKSYSFHQIIVDLIEILMLTSFSISCAIHFRKTFFCSWQMENPVAEQFWMLSQAFFFSLSHSSSFLHLPQIEARFAQIWRIFNFTVCLKNKSDSGDTKHMK